MINSKKVASAAIMMAMTPSIEEEKRLKQQFKDEGIKTAAVNIGGNLVESIVKVLESTLVAAKRNDIIEDIHVYDGALAGATREALEQILDKSVGFNAGGKVGIARHREHLSVCIFLTIGLLNLDDVVIGLGHRVVPAD